MCYGISGILNINRYPEYSRISTPVIPRLPETTRGQPEMIPTSKDPTAIKGGAKAAVRPDAAPATLKAVLDALEGRRDLAPNRLRDLRSAVTRVAKFLGDAPGHIPLELPALSAKLAAINPVAAGLTAKTFSNIRSGF